MTQKETDKVLIEHAKWLAGKGGARAYLARADLTRANLAGANLAGANLARADLTDAYLTDAYLTGANLADAYLTGANLARANLTDAYLTGANLAGANLTDANLTDADLTGATYAVSGLLRADWGKLPDNLTLELMRHDAESCGTKAMTEWAKGGQCPFDGNLLRDFYFVENRKLWRPGKPKLRGIALLEALAKAENIKL